ncbi:MAG: hypothetical protein P1U40_08705 [Coxiellaceae bacterium]|nr:hypothetical protein [Coxiellaceae bacterium]
MNYDKLLSMSCYDIEQDEKQALLLPILNDMVRYHNKHCLAYNKIISSREGWSESYFKSIEKLPYVAVQLFKYLDLHSMGTDSPFRVMQSSGTTGAAISKIYLDQYTAKLQSTALIKIMQNYLGKHRLPMLIIDKASTIKNREQFSARSAGIKGLYSFGRHHTFALDEQMGLKWDAIEEFIEKYKHGPVFIFGFTFMIWQYFYKSLNKTKKKLDLSNAILFHSGGWKKLESEAVSNSDFKQCLKETMGIANVHNFYGMVEQVGSIFVECKEGHLHAPLFADIIIRDFSTGKPSAVGGVGQIQVISVLPISYPGISILTEDMGVLLGVDDCKCGKKGKYFLVIGRIPKAEVRGCSDTHEMGRG